MTRQAVISLLRKITAVPATQQVRGIPSEVPLDEETGCPRRACSTSTAWRSCRNGWFVEPICRLPPVRMVQACRALSVALGC
jgi:mRNA-degrading endonuclease toxin of MazEF toxin-antitoxin module